jgi:hypothetical protein
MSPIGNAIAMAAGGAALGSLFGFAGALAGAGAGTIFAAYTVLARRRALRSAPVGS